VLAVTGLGRYTVDYYSIDAVGNTEAQRTAVVTIKDVATLVNYTAPALSGSATVGSTLTASTGTWNTTGLDFEVEWLRNGVVVPGAEGTTYPVTTADIGKRISARVTASKPELTAVSATTAATVAVPKTATTTALSLSSSSVKRKVTVVFSATVASAVGTPTGTVSFYSGSTRLKTVTMVNGQATLPARFTVAGNYKIRAVYSGSAAHVASSSATASLRIR